MHLPSTHLVVLSAQGLVSRLRQGRWGRNGAMALPVLSNNARGRRVRARHGGAARGRGIVDAIPSPTHLVGAASGCARVADAFAVLAHIGQVGALGAGSALGGRATRATLA